MIKFSPAEALLCMGLTAAVFFSGGPGAELLDPGFYRETRSKVPSCSLAYQVLGYHREAPAFPLKSKPLPVKAEPAERAGAKVRAIGRRIWSTVTRPFGKPSDALEAS